MADGTKAGWTPGPWVASFEEMGGYDCMSDSWDVHDGIGRKIVSADLGKRPSDAHSAIVAANARLIAAAPDLADVAARLVEWDCRIENGEDEIGDGFYAALVRDARAALARARGDAQ